MSATMLPRPASVPAGYEAAWPAAGLPAPLWTANAPPAGRNNGAFNLAAIDLGLSAGCESDEFRVDELYAARCGHFHQAYGEVLSPGNFRLFEENGHQAMGPMLASEDSRSVFAEIGAEGQVLRYVSGIWTGGFPGGIHHFAHSVEDLMRIIDWDSEPVTIPVGYWCPSGANGPRIR